ncbi:hypothetical protein KAZ01_00635 [Candidatus Gracilibacteria bacterium]|nr:hypothetical protein [Candidatus Gracilibacteria bacterium]
MNFCYADAKDIRIDNPGLPDFGKKTTVLGIFSVDNSTATGFLTTIIAEVIKYTGVLAIIALTIGGLMYITSYGAEAQTKKAKDIIIYSIIGVILSISAYTLVSIINNFTL